MPRRQPVVASEQPNVNVQVQMPPAAERTPETPEEKPDMWFWDQLAAIPTEKWGRVNSVIGERVDPKVPGVPGSKGFLFELFEPITLSYFKNNYGGGTFKAVLMENGRFKTSHQFNIFGAPKYDLTRESPAAISGGTPQNNNGDKEVLQQFVAVLREELTRSREANSGGVPGADRMMEMITNASEKAIEIVKNQTPQSTDQLTQLTQMAALLKNLMPQPQESGLLALLTPLIKPLLERLVQPVDPLAQVTAFLGIFEKIDAIRGSGGAGGGDGKPKDWKAMLAEGVVQKGPEILKELRETMEVNRAANAERRAAAEANRQTMEIARTMPPVPGAPPVAAVPSVMPSAGPIRVVPINSMETAPQAAVPAAPPPAAEGFSSSESDAVANFMKKKIVQMIADGRDAEDIVEFIEDVDSTVNDTLAQFAPKLVTTFLAGDPILAVATKHPNWNDFLEDAQEYIKKIRAEDAVIEAQANAVPS